MIFIIRETLILAAIAITIGSARANDPDPTPDEVRQLLRGNEVQNDDFPKLVKLGARALPAYEKLLTDPESRPLELRVILQLVSDINADLSRFHDIALNILTHAEPTARLGAIEFFSAVGRESDTPPILAMLSDSEPEVRNAAAKALARIGGKRDLVAMDIWLRTGNYQNDARHLRHVRDCRDKLEQRLKEAEKKEKEKEKK